MADAIVKLSRVSKFYKLYDSKRDRFREALDPWRRKRHREFYALRDVNLEVKRNEILGIVGRNGAGKTTLLKVIAGVVPANSGQVAVNGKVSAMLDVSAGLNPDLDGIQNIYFGGIMLGFSRQEMRRKLDDIVAFADIGDFIRQPMRTYSSGMRARLGFALAVNVDPEILIVDEVLAVGDELFRRKCYARMEALLKGGCTVFYVSHNINTVNELCTRAVLFDGGELLLDGPTKAVTMYYLRLMNASKETQAVVRSEIRDLNKNPAKKGNISFSSARQEKKDLSDDESLDRLMPFYIPELVPQSTLIQKNHDVAIEDIQLTTAIGERVNVLVMGEEYHLSFKVRFDMDAIDVGFGVAIKSQKGVNLCNCNSKGDFIPFIEKGREATVHFYFTCNLLQGSYFFTLNAAADISGKREVLMQIQDALVFKVLKDKKTMNIGGLLYCNQFLETEIT